MKNLPNNNPICYNNHNLVALDEAYASLLEMLEEYVLQNNVSASQVEEVKELFLEAYQEKKVEYCLDFSVNRLFGRLDSMVNNALGQHSKTNKNYTDFLYLRHTKQTTSHERFEFA